MGKVILSGVSKGMTAPAGLSPILNDNTWEQIRAASDAGIASTLWKVGDCKEITLNGTVGNTTFDNYTIYAYIIGFDHNTELEGSNRIHFQLGKTSLEDGTDVTLCDATYGSSVSETGYFSLNSSNTNSGGWASCQMRTVICEAMKNVISPELLAVLKPVAKYTDNTGNNSTEASAVTLTTDYFFLLSEYEVFGAISWANTNEANYQKQYAYYSMGNSKIRYKHNATSTKASWILRSPVSTRNNCFADVRDTGAVDINGSSYSLGFAPAFCV